MRVDLAAPPTAKGRATRARLLAAVREQALATGGTLEVATVAADVPSVVYRYFGSKAGLVNALIDDFFDRLHAEVLDRDLAQLGAWAARERHRLELGVRFHYNEPLSVVVYALLAREPEVALAHSARMHEVVAQAARNISHGQRQGEVDRAVDARLAGAAMFGAMREVLVEALGRARRLAAAKVVDLDEGLRIEAQCFNRSIASPETLEGLRRFNERDHPDCRPGEGR